MSTELGDADHWLLSFGAALVAGTWYAMGPGAVTAEPAEGAVSQVDTQPPGAVLGKSAADDLELVEQARAEAAPPPPKKAAAAPVAPKKRKRNKTHIHFAPPTSASSEAVLTSAINITSDMQAVPEPDDTLLPGHKFPEIQGKPSDLKVGSTQNTKERAPAGQNPMVARFPSAQDPPGCDGTSHCINFGGHGGFPYNAATEEERAAFRAVISHYARKGDSVTIKYMENTVTQMPPSRGPRRAACGMWKGIEPDVDVATCVANDGYVKERLHSRNRAHHSVLTDLLRRSWAAVPGRDAPRTGAEVPRLDPDFREKLEREVEADGTNSNKVSTIVVEGPGTVPYLDALKAAFDPKRLEKEEHVIHAITQQCEILGARELHMDELGESTFMRNYPQDKQEPRGRYYLRRSDDYGLVANAFEEDAKTAPDEWTGEYDDAPKLLPSTS